MSLQPNFPRQNETSFPEREKGNDALPQQTVEMDGLVAARGLQNYRTKGIVPISSPAARDGVINRARRGSVILIVLITIMFATAALTLFIEKASNDLLVDARESDALRLRMEAYSALETTLGVLEDFRLVATALHSPAEGWSQPLEFANYEPGSGRVVEVQFEDESAKISLPESEPTGLMETFKSWGLGQNDAQKLTDALLGWMRKDYIPGSAASPRPEDYEHGEMPFSPPARSLRSFRELASIDYARKLFFDENGEPTPLYERFVSTFSLYSYKKANINGGNLNALAGLGITDESQRKRVQDYLKGGGTFNRRGAQFFKSPQDVATLLGASSPGANLSTEISALRIIVTVREGHSSFRLNTLIAPQGGAKIPPRTSEAAPADGQPKAAAEPPPTATTQSSTATNGSKSLNYPFTILEIRENDEIPSAPTEPAI